MQEMWCSLVQPGARECGAAWCSLVQENVLPSAPLCAAWCNIMFHYNCHSCTHTPCVVSRSNTAYTWHSGFPEVCPGQVAQMGGPCPGRQQVDMEAMGDARPPPHLHPTMETRTQQVSCPLTVGIRVRTSLLSQIEGDCGGLWVECGCTLTP